jgi:hypothetical protein
MMWETMFPRGLISLEAAILLVVCLILEVIILLGIPLIILLRIPIFLRELPLGSVMIQGVIILSEVPISLEATLLGGEKSFWESIHHQKL